MVSRGDFTHHFMLPRSHDSESTSSSSSPQRQPHRDELRPKLKEKIKPKRGEIDQVQSDSPQQVSKDKDSPNILKESQSPLSRHRHRRHDPDLSGHKTHTKRDTTPKHTHRRTHRDTRSHRDTRTHQRHNDSIHDRSESSEDLQKLSTSHNPSSTPPIQHSPSKPPHSPNTSPKVAIFHTIETLCPFSPDSQPMSTFDSTAASLPNISHETTPLSPNITTISTLPPLSPPQTHLEPKQNEISKDKVVEELTNELEKEKAKLIEAEEKIKILEKELAELRRSQAEYQRESQKFQHERIILTRKEQAYKQELDRANDTSNGYLRTIYQQKEEMGTLTSELRHLRKRLNETQLDLVGNSTPRSYSSFGMAHSVDNSSPLNTRVSHTPQPQSMAKLSPQIPPNTDPQPQRNIRLEQETTPGSEQRNIHRSLKDKYSPYTRSEPPFATGF
ncbi:hypothetical protein BLNAU_13057 [Blattamonas nauphoetae]|uniref:Uncharacterized protein n=1 Tax=Blattamonas nauphoetae TaxID=2049346 RepID=A0ABQ9XMX1_9EUKA|nr:hypothetical protein BLNAU_13057 [Blattamonas nauphoetae]